MTATSAPFSTLLVHAGESSRREILSLCRESGWQCDCYVESDRLLAAAAAKQYDLVIVEASSNLFDAGQVVEKLQRTHPSQPLIIVRSVAHLEAIVRGRERHTVISDFLVAERSEYRFRTDEIASHQTGISILERLERIGKVDEQLGRKLEVAFQEALTNACDHGNLELESRWREQIAADGTDHYSSVRRERLAQPQYAARRITVKTEYDGARLEIRVCDEGRGFQYGAGPSSHSGTVCHGRGLKLIHATMDQVWHEEGGRVIVMVKNISGRTKIGG